MSPAEIETQEYVALNYDGTHINYINMCKFSE